MIAPGDLRKAMHEIAGRKGDFTVFGLFMRADAPLVRSDDLGTWDLVASAPWLEGSRLKATTELVDLLKKTMGRKLVQELSRVVIIPGEDPTVQFLLRSVPVEDGEHHIRGIDLPRQQIERAIIFRAWPPEPKKRARKELHPAAAGASRGRG